MIQPIITANQAIANKTMVTSPYFAGKMKEADEPKEASAPVTCPVDCPACAPTTTTDSSTKGEKHDINFEGCREYSLNGNKINYFA